MEPGTLAAALGRSFGRFVESWGNEFDPDDPTDVWALSELLFQELDLVVEREALEEARRMVREFGRGD